MVGTWFLILPFELIQNAHFDLAPVTGRNQSERFERAPLVIFYSHKGSKIPGFSNSSL
jgi:hypothetical protein